MNIQVQYSEEPLTVVLGNCAVQSISILVSISITATAVISGSLSPRHGASLGCGWRNGLQYGG